MGEKHKDWKGNIIQEGDTVLKVRVKNWDAGVKYSLIEFTIGEDNYSEIEPVEAEEKRLWEICEEILIKSITEDDGVVWMSFLKPYVETPLWCAGMHLSCQHNEILCIKGKSDSQEDYFLEKFKVQ